MAKEKRKDKSRVVLRVGEIQRNDGTYQYSWMDADHKRRLDQKQKWLFLFECFLYYLLQIQ